MYTLLYIYIYPRVFACICIKQTHPLFLLKFKFYTNLSKRKKVIFIQSKEWNASPGPARCCCRRKCPGKKDSPMTGIARRSKGRTDKCGRPHPYTSGSARVASIPRRTSFQKLENHASNNSKGGARGRSRERENTQACLRQAELFRRVSRRHYSHAKHGISLQMADQRRSVPGHQGLADKMCYRPCAPLDCTGALLLVFIMRCEGVSNLGHLGTSECFRINHEATKMPRIHDFGERVDERKPGTYVAYA